MSVEESSDYMREILIALYLKWLEEGEPVR